LKQRTAGLREELEMEQLRTRALNVMIDIAEERFDLPIRKKPGAKQWKK
jgi:transposase